MRHLHERLTLKEFQQFVTPDDGRKFAELYNVQHLGSNVIDPVARVTISTIQRLYSVLRGEAELAEEFDEQSAYAFKPSGPRDAPIARLEASSPMSPTAATTANG